MGYIEDAIISSAVKKALREYKEKMRPILEVTAERMVRDAVRKHMDDARFDQSLEGMSEQDRSAALLHREMVRNGANPNEAARLILSRKTEEK